ncbi:MAG: L,D-transpeptidase [Rhodobacteraceae bacterium]|nr:L,D-transpeptidase [Paracoccaceae bacterium]
MNWNRRDFLTAIGAFAFCAAPGAGYAVAEQGFGLDYLEALGQPGGINPKIAFVPPSRIDPAYSHAIYVNTATGSASGQKMWVIERNGASWQVARWDEDFWAKKGVEGIPPFSWPISTGIRYAGDRRSGPTPLGIFNPDDRNHRHRRGWSSPGMYNSIYIDLHYGSGRASGVAMHGTPRGNYRRLGRAASHGCIRMRQGNSDKVWKLFHGSGRPGTSSPLWSEAVPRYFATPPTPTASARRDYVRDGSVLMDELTGERLTKPGYSVLFVFFRDDL